MADPRMPHSGMTSTQAAEFIERMSAPDQTNAEVSDERLRERADALWEQLLPHMQVAAHASGARSAYDDKVAAIGFIMAELNRRSVTSQASEGAVTNLLDDAWQKLLDKDDRTSPEEYPDMVLITREELASVIVAAASPSKRVQRLGTALRNALPAYEDWMDGHADDVKSATCRQLTFGEIREAYALLGGRS